MWKLTFRWQYCLPHLTAVSCSLGNIPSAAKMPLCPANPMVTCWFLIHLNESLWWSWHLSFHRRWVKYGWLAGLYAYPLTNTQMRSRWGGQAPGHSHPAGLGRGMWEQKKYSNVKVAKAILRAMWGTTYPAHVAHKNSLDLIPQSFYSLAFSSSCSWFVKTTTSAYFSLWLTFFKPDGHNEHKKIFIWCWNHTLYAGGCSHTLEIALPGAAVWGLMLLQTQTFEGLEWLQVYLL